MRDLQNQVQQGLELEGISVLSDSAFRSELSSGSIQLFIFPQVHHSDLKVKEAADIDYGSRFSLSRSAIVCQATFNHAVSDP